MFKIILKGLLLGLCLIMLLSGICAFILTAYFSMGGHATKLPAYLPYLAYIILFISCFIASWKVKQYSLIIACFLFIILIFLQMYTIPENLFQIITNHYLHLIFQFGSLLLAVLSYRLVSSFQK